MFVPISENLSIYIERGWGRERGSKEKTPSVLVDAY
jgi:hypothetical protein